MDDTMTIDLLTDEFDDEYEDEDIVQLGQENTVAELVSLEASGEEMEEAQSEGQSIPLLGSRLGAVDYDEEETEDLARVRLQATPRMLFVSSSQPSPSEPGHERRPLFLSPPNKRRSKRITEFVEKCRDTTIDDPETPMVVAS